MFQNIQNTFERHRRISHFHTNCFLKFSIFVFYLLECRVFFKALYTSIFVYMLYTYIQSITFRKSVFFFLQYTTPLNCTNTFGNNISIQRGSNFNIVFVYIVLHNPFQVALCTYIYIVFRRPYFSFSYHISNETIYTTCMYDKVKKKNAEELFNT